MSTIGATREGTAPALRMPDIYARLAYEDERAALDYLVRVFQLAEIREARTETDESTLAWLESLGTLSGQKLVAIEGPQPPEYYSSNMELSVVIDRGDVWYEFPYDDQGRERMIGLPEVGCSASRCVIIPRLERHAHCCRYGPGSYCGGQLVTPAQIRSSAAPMYSYGETTGSCMSGRREAGAVRTPRHGTT